jgi:putative protease
MSPAGHWPQLHAAIEAGADAVYFGLTHFTARAKVGFSLAELPVAMRTLHQRGVKGFVTFNTLIFEDELTEAANTIAAIADAGADAIIVQDPAILKLARQIAPQLELHASTQMSISDAAGVEFARSLGAARVTLARELSLAEIGAIRRTTDCDLEIFVHGALCVAYSGQCFSSEAWGGRSANRGQCAQACRLPYELIVDDQVEPLADARYLLSPGDLCSIDHVPQMVELGIAALKIEGRYKDAEYVALTTRAYRRAVDAAYAQKTSPITVADKLQLEQVYSRGLGAHFLTGTNHQAVVQGRAPRHRGVLAGRVTRVLSNAVEVETSDAMQVSPLKPGDGLVFDAANWRSPQEPEEGGRLYELEAQPNGAWQLRFANNALNFARIRAGDLVWRSHDPELDRVVRPFLEPATPVRKQPLTVRVDAHEGRPLQIEWKLPSGRSVITTSDEPLAHANSRGLTEEVVRAQLGRLGSTPYEIDSLTLDIAGAPFAQASLLNQLRREAVEELQALQSVVGTSHVEDPGKVLSAELHAAVTSERGTPQLHLLVRTAEQLDAALQLTPASITLDYLDLYGLKPSVERVKAAGIAVRESRVPASPQTRRGTHRRIPTPPRRADCWSDPPDSCRPCKASLIGEGELTGDFSLNAANSITADRASYNSACRRITPAHDLNAAQIAALAERDRRRIAWRWSPITICPSSTLEHCVFCRFLSTGTSYQRLRPALRKTHVVALQRFASGRAHPAGGRRRLPQHCLWG